MSFNNRPNYLLMTKVTVADNVPKEQHYAVLIYNTKTTYIPGDQRSKDYPGHGYPERYETEVVIEHYVTLEKFIWKEFVTQLHNSGEKNFVFFEVPKISKINTSIEIV